VLPPSGWSRDGEEARIKTRLFVYLISLCRMTTWQEIKDLFPEWRDAIIQADGLVIDA